MIVGILSDTHDQAARTARAVDALVRAGAQVLIHCGDLTSGRIVSLCGPVPAYFVFGNCDFDQAEIRAAVEALGGQCLGLGGLIELHGKRIAVTHGDQPGAVRDLLAKYPHYLLSGHSHVRLDHCEGATRRINPGALHRASSYSVAVLDLETDGLTFLNVD